MKLILLPILLRPFLKQNLLLLGVAALLSFVSAGKAVADDAQLKQAEGFWTTASGNRRSTP